MTTETLLYIFAGVIAAAMLLQAVSIWRAYRAVQDLAGHVQSKVDHLEVQTQRVMAQINEVATGLEPLAALSKDIQQQVDALQQRFDQRTQDIDSLVEELLMVGRKQAVKVDQVVSDTVDKFEETTSVIQQDILRPVIEISSFVKGLRTGFDYLFSRRETRPVAESYPEEEMFI